MMYENLISETFDSEMVISGSVAVLGEENYKQQKHKEIDDLFDLFVSKRTAGNNSTKGESFISQSSKSDADDSHGADEFNSIDNNDEIDKQNQQIQKKANKISGIGYGQSIFKSNVSYENKEMAVAAMALEEENKRNEELTQQIDELFNFFDTEGTGNIKKRHFTYFLNNIIGQSDGADQLFEQFDTSGNGKISKYNFFRAILANEEWAEQLNKLNGSGQDRTGMINEALAEKVSKSTTREMFELYDIDGDGTITKKEFKYVMQNMFGMQISDEEIENRIMEADADGNGEISLDEFVMIMWKINWHDYVRSMATSSKKEGENDDNNMLASIAQSSKKVENSDMLASTRKLVNRRKQNELLANKDLAASVPTSRVGRRQLGRSAIRTSSSNDTIQSPRRTKSSNESLRRNQSFPLGMVDKPQSRRRRVAAFTSSSSSSETISNKTISRRDEPVATMTSSSKKPSITLSRRGESSSREKSSKTISRRRGNAAAVTSSSEKSYRTLSRLGEQTAVAVASSSSSRRLSRSPRRSKSHKTETADYQPSLSNSRSYPRRSKSYQTEATDYQPKSSVSRSRTDLRRSKLHKSGSN